MPAYLIVQARVDDADQISKYVEAVQPQIAAHGGKPIARGVPQVMEGDWPWQTVGIVQFPTFADGERFWNSPDYRAIIPLREGASQFQVLLIDGEG